MTAALRVGVVGAGYFCRFHLDAWRRIPGVDIAGVADLDPRRARETLTDALGSAHGVPVYEDAAALLAEQRIDILDIVSPPPTHAELIAASFEHPIRATICQKPFCASLDEARAMVDRIEAAGRLVVVHENFRFQPWYRALARALDDGLIGAPHQVTFRLRPGDGQGPQAYLDRQPYFQTMERLLIHETAVHWIDTFRFLFGEPTAVFADIRRMNPAIVGEDAAMFIFRYADGRRALFDGDRLLDHAAGNTRLTMGEAILEGEGGEIRVSGDAAVMYRRFGEMDWSSIAFEASRLGFGGDCVRELQAHVCDHLLTGAPVENAARDYLRNIEIEAALYRSASTGAVEQV